MTDTTDNLRGKRISDDDLTKIKEANPLLDVVEQHVTLRRSGRQHKGLCPFHDERTPSFYVNELTNTWKCFGCGLGGDVIDFVKNIEGGQNFRYAAQLLAERSNIELQGAEDDADDRKARELRAMVYDINSAAADFYASCLQHDPEARTAREFLRARHFTGQHAATYGCGYAPQSGKDLLVFLADQGFTAEQATAAGLAIQAKNSGRYYDRFQGRLTWAIRNEFDKVVGFGARRIYDNDRIEAKFINTSETPVYKKSEVLYGFDMARPAITKQHHVIVVEGYADVMACHAAGITNAVATCGTSLTKEHLRILRRSVGDSGEITFGFDSDNAGRKATLAAYDMAQGSVRRLTAFDDLGGKDPELARRERGDEAVRAIVASRVPLLQRVIDATISRFPLDTPEDKAYAASEAANLLVHVDDTIARGEYATHVAHTIGVRPGDITSRIPNARGETATPDTRPVPKLPTQAKAEQNLLRVFALDQPTARYLFFEAKDFIITPAGKAIAHGIEGAFTAEPGPSWFDRVRAHIPTEADGLLIDLATQGLPVANNLLFDYTRGLIAQLTEIAENARLTQWRDVISATNDTDEKVQALDELIAAARSTTHY